MNDEGIPSSGRDHFPGRGADFSPRWGTTQVHRIFHRAEYKGEAYGLQTERADGGRPGKPGKRVTKPLDKQVRLPDETTPALVSPELWEATQERLRTNRGDITRNAMRPYLLRGFITCAVCGRRMTADRDHGRPIYRCISRMSPDGPCGGKSVPAADSMPKKTQPRNATGQCIAVSDDIRQQLSTVPGVETWAWEQVAAILKDPSIISAEVERQRAHGPDPLLVADLAAARRQYRDLDRKQANLAAGLATTEPDSTMWRLVQQEIERYDQQKAAVRQTIDEIEQRVTAQQHMTQQLAEVTEYVEQVGGNLDAFGFDEKRLALEALGVQVEASGRDWTIHYRIPTGPSGDDSRQSVPTIWKAGRPGDKSTSTSTRAESSPTTALLKAFASMLHPRLAIARLYQSQWAACCQTYCDERYI